LPVGTSFIYGPAAIRNGEIYVWASSALYRYQPNQQAWALAGSGTLFRDRDSFVVTEKSFFLIGRENNPPQIVFRSDDAGASWRALSRGLPMNQFTASASKVFALISDGPFLYASATGGRDLTMPGATAPGSIYASDDDGETWGVATKSLPISASQIDVGAPGLFSPIVVNGADIFAANEGKLYRATMTPPVVSAASYRSLDLSGESIGAIFGTNLASGVAQGQDIDPMTPGIQLPTTLGGVTVKITDRLGASRNAPLFFVSPGQINLQIPGGTATGPANVEVMTSAGNIVLRRVEVFAAAPSLFTADASGRGIPAAVALRLKSDGSLIYEPIYQFDQSSKPVAIPIEVSRADETVFLLLYGTGIRGRSDLSKVMAKAGGEILPVEFAGAAPDFVGLDQVNLRLSRALAGRGATQVELEADGRRANPVNIMIR
jgi:uncharacterized protein (TIGR03437 family)